MKREILLCSAVLLLPVSATAQEESKLHFLLNGGLSLPLSPDEFKNGWSEGFNVGGGVGYRFSRHFSFQALVNYDRFPLDEEGFADQFTIFQFRLSGGAVSILSVSGELKASLVGDPNKVSPYVTAGGGIAHVSSGDLMASEPEPDLILTPYDYVGLNNPFLDPRFSMDFTIEGESETKAMATVGGGVDIPIGGRIGIFVEGRYQWNFTADERTNFASFRAGVQIGL